MANQMMEKSASNSPSVPTARDPFTAMRDEMNDLISRIWGGQASTALSGWSNAPALDVSEDEDAYEIRVDAPGVKSEDFEIEVHGKSVIVSGKREEKQEEKSKKFHRVERTSGSFSRAVSLPNDINEEAVEANYSDGVLTITLPKTAKSKSRKIEVRS